MHAKNTIHSSKSRGQSLVELAFLLPILLLLVLGAMDVGRLFSVKITLTNAAREGANYLSRHPDEWTNTTNTVAAIQGEASVLTGYQITAIQCSGSCDTGDTATVTVESSIPLISLSFFRAFGDIQLSSTVEMMVQ